MKKLFLISLIFTFSLQAYDYLLEDGWQMVGAMENVEDTKIFDNSCIKEIWRFDNKTSSWKYYIQSEKGKATLTSFNEADGLWIKISVACPITIPSKLPFTTINYIEDYSNDNSNKRFELVDNQNRLNELYLTYLDSNSTPKIDFNSSSIIFLKSSNSEYSQSTIKEIKQQYLNYNIAYIDTLIIKGDCKELDTKPIEFISFDKKANKNNIGWGRDTLFSESVTLKNCDGKDINKTFEEISFREIDLMSNYGDIGVTDKKRLEVVQNSKIFEYLYYNHINPITDDKELPSIDFEKETLLAIFRGLHGSTGYKIRVSKVKEYDSYIEVEIENDLPGYYCAVGTAMTSPVTFITIPKTNKEVIFKEYPNIEICEDWTKEYE